MKMEFLHIKNKLFVFCAVFLIFNIFGSVQCHRLPKSKELSKTSDSNLTEILNRSSNDTSSREARRSVVSGGLFSIVSFDNVPCNSTNGDIGVCYSARECSNLGGVAGGSCAGNFGVCCSVTYTSGATIKTNNTYFVNPGYPAPTTGPLTSSVTIPQLPGATELYLEFTDFNIRGPSSGVCSNDTFTINVCGTVYPILCGNLTGDSLYFPLSSATAGRKRRDVDMAKKFNKIKDLSALTSKFTNPTTLCTATLTITLADGTDIRDWKIRIVQFKPTDACAAPVGCNQYFRTSMGTVQTFNYNNGQGELIENSGCFTQCFYLPSGYCSVRLTENEFMLPGTEPSECTTDYLLANGVKYCGQSLNGTGTLSVASNTGTNYASIQYCTGASDPDMDVGYNLQYSLGSCSSTG